MVISTIERLTKCYKVIYLKPFGLEISANMADDFTALIEGEDLKELVRFFRLVVLRGFKGVSKDPLVQYAKRLGALLEWEFGSVMEMQVQAAPKNYLFTHGHVPFHWDGAFHQEPRFLLFQCVAAPLVSAGGETLFTDTHRIWLDASDEEKSSWASYSLNYKTEKLAHYGGEINVRLVKDHLDTREKILRFAEPVPATLLNPVDVKVNGVARCVEKHFIDDMTARCYDVAYCYMHTWQLNDFLIADNQALIHARRAFKQFTPRHLRRIQVL